MPEYVFRQCTAMAIITIASYVIESKNAVLKFSTGKTIQSKIYKKPEGLYGELRDSGKEKKTLLAARMSETNPFVVVKVDI